MPFLAQYTPDVLERFDFGGVDSRSNPINMPLNRAVRVLNWVPLQGGWLRLRYGYAVVPQGAPTDARQYFDGGSPPPLTLPIHSLDYYSSWDTQAHFVLYGQAGRISRMNVLDGSTSYVASLASASKWNSFRANNKIYLGNGTDMLWYDGTKFRRIGLKAFDPALFSLVTVTAGVREMLTAEISAMTKTVAAGGSFPVTVASGLQFYASAFDPAANDLGPANAVGSRVTIATTGNKVTFGGMPNWGAISKGWLTVLSATADGQFNAYFLTKSSAAIGSVSRAFGVTTVTLGVGTSVPAGDVVRLVNVLDPSFNGIFYVTSAAANVFTFNQAEQPDANSTGGICYDLVVVGNGGGSVDATAFTIDPTFITQTGIGLPATVVVTDNVGYQFYISPYRVNAGGHVGNRIPIGSRLILANRSTVRIANLPDISTVDSELVGLIGRTGDGAQIPYACTDSAGNFISLPIAQDEITISSSTADFNSELPYRNDQPKGMDKFCRVASRVYGNPMNSPFIYRSASETDQTTGQFVGVAAESWPAGQVETFPTAEAVTCLVDYDSEAWVFSRNNLAILDESAGYVNWQGPYPTGAAGPRAFAKTDHGPFWLSGKRQLCTRGNTGPLPISEEYEAALLRRIGPQFLSAVELSYFNDPEKALDYVSIRAQDANGVPFEIIHDFKLRDDRSPYGQGYIRQFLGPLASLFSIKTIEDEDFITRLWAGGSDGNLYELEGAWNDAGQEFTADWIGLANIGPERLSMASLGIQGDGNTEMSWLNRLDRTVDDMEILSVGERKGDEVEYIYNRNIKHTEARHAFVRFQLTSHSVDATKSFLNGLGVNDPPHFPLEVYGSVFAARVETSTGRGA